MLALYIFVNRLFPIKLQPMDWKPATLSVKCFAKISLRKFSDNLKSYREESIWENLCVGVPFLMKLLV